MAKDTAQDDPFLRDLWYFGAAGQEIKPGQMIQKERLGELILIGRTHRGEVFALTDICPHRAILLSGGEMVKGETGSEVQCPYHGWRFRPDGQCAHIPSLTADQAEMLGAVKGDAGLLAERIGFNAKGAAIEFSQSWYRGDTYDFVAELSLGD